jgi:peroxiredoxin
MYKRIFFIMVLFIAIFSITIVIFNQHASLANNGRTKSLKEFPKHHQEKREKSVPEVGLAIGNRAPNIVLENLQGQIVNLTDFRGKKVLLNFWATWCSPCRTEIPQIVQFYKRMDHSEMAVLAVNVTSMEEGGAKSVQAFAQKNGMSFPILLDPHEETISTYGIVTIPTTYLLNEKGVIIAKHIGPVDKVWINKYM